MGQLKDTCLACQGTGWLCEEHPAQPWDHGDCDGVGIACSCNESAALPRPDVFVEYDLSNEMH